MLITRRAIRSLPAFSRLACFISIALCASLTAPVGAGSPRVLAAADEEPSWVDDLSPLAAKDWTYDRAAHLLGPARGMAAKKRRGL
jgi:hypothetical protein